MMEDLLAAFDRAFWNQEAQRQYAQLRSQGIDEETAKSTVSTLTGVQPITVVMWEDEWGTPQGSWGEPKRAKRELPYYHNKRRF